MAPLTVGGSSHPWLMQSFNVGMARGYSPRQLQILSSWQRILTVEVSQKEIKTEKKNLLNSLLANDNFYFSQLKCIQYAPRARQQSLKGCETILYSWKWTHVRLDMTKWLKPIKHGQNQHCGVYQLFCVLVMKIPWPEGAGVQNSVESVAAGAWSMEQLITITHTQEGERKIRKREEWHTSRPSQWQTFPKAASPNGTITSPNSTFNWGPSVKYMCLWGHFSPNPTRRAVLNSGGCEVLTAGGRLCILSVVSVATHLCRWSCCYFSVLKNRISTRWLSLVWVIWSQSKLSYDFKALLTEPKAQTGILNLLGNLKLVACRSRNSNSSIAALPASWGKTEWDLSKQQTPALWAQLKHVWAPPGTCERNGHRKAHHY